MDEKLTHWKKLDNPDYIGTWIFDKPGQQITLTIREVKNEIVTGADGKKEECTVAYFKEAKKPMILNTTNKKAIAKIAKSPYIEKWIGVQITLHAEQVKAFGEVVDALRVIVPKSQAKDALK